MMQSIGSRKKIKFTCKRSFFVEIYGLIFHSRVNFIFVVNPDSFTGANCDSQVDTDSGADSNFGADSNSGIDSGFRSEVNSGIGFGIGFGVNSEIGSGIDSGIGNG